MQTAENAQAGGQDWLEESGKQEREGEDGGGKEEKDDRIRGWISKHGQR
jgi:hypothetical protein